MSVVACRYAEGLFALALEKNKLALYKEQIAFIQSVLLDEEIKEFLCSKRINKTAKKELLSTAFKGQIDDYLDNFLSLLVDKNRIEEYEAIIVEFIKLCNQELHIKVGLIESPHLLNAELVKELATSLSKNGEKVELHFKLNKTLISGFRISFEGQVIDNTMKQKIEKLEKLLKGKDGNLWK